MSKKSHPLINTNLIESTLFLRRSINPAEIRHSDLVRPAWPYGTVMKNPDGKWRMWYTELLHVHNETHEALTCENTAHYAESDDGLHWRKPELGLVDWRGSKANNCIMGTNYIDSRGRDLTDFTGPEGFCVLDAEKTPVPHARARYTALTLLRPADQPGGLALLYSDDGLRWTGYDENPIIVGWPDTLNSFFYDTRINKYVMYMRPTVHVGTWLCNRMVARATSDDMVNWSVPRTVLDTDEADVSAFEEFSELGQTSPQRGRIIQYYAMTVYPYDGVYVAIALLYNSSTGISTLELVHSDDGIRWNREPVRVPFAQAGPEHDFISFHTTTANSPIVHGDEMWMYAGCIRNTHHDFFKPGADQQKLTDGHTLGLLTIKRDRWVSYEAAEHEGELLTTPFEWKGGQMLLNASIEEGGYIVTEFCNELGHAIPLPHHASNEVMHGPMDEIEAPVAIRIGEPKHKLLHTTHQFNVRGPIRMRIKMKKAKLYGWTTTL